MASETPAPLAADEATRLTEFARALKAAARAVVLYPGGHPAVATTIGRIVQLTSPAHLPAPMRINVLTRGLLLNGRAPARIDPAVEDLAVLLHDHLVGELTIYAGGDIEGWRNFLQLVGRSSDSVRTDGGIAQLWTTIAGRHIELKEIDYTEVLRERSGGDPATWERIISSCLQGDGDRLDAPEESLRGLLELAANAEGLGNLIAALDARATSGGQTLEGKTAAVIRLIQGIVDIVNKEQPDRLDPILRNVAGAVGQLSPEMMVSLLSRTVGGDSGSSPGVIGAVVTRMSDETIARFVSRNATVEDTSMDRLVQAFQTLVQDGGERQRLLALARDDAAASPLGSTAGFEEVWSHVAERLLRSYSDEPFISTEYARELSGARTQAMSVEQVSDDPPERVTAWLATVATSELRELDLTLLTDLLRIEEDTQRWGELITPVVALVEDLLLVGDFDIADELLSTIKREAGPETTKERRQAALIGFDLLAAGPMMRHVVGHLATIDEAQFERVKGMCISFGDVLVRPLAEALSTEERSRPRERLTAILIGFGAAGRRQVERLKTSANPAVRRTAIYLLREFGGTDALPDLTELLDDNEPQVQREAIRAILNIGTDRAYRVLEQALQSGSNTSREAIMRSIGARDERATPLFAYIVGHVDHRGPLGAVYLRAIESLGQSRDPEGIPALKEALYRGEWWAPRRSAMFRRAAAAALARIATSEAVEALDEALQRGPRGVRAAAKEVAATVRRSKERKVTT